MKYIFKLITGSENNRRWLQQVGRGKRKTGKENASNIYENHKLIIIQNLGYYFGFWVKSEDLEKARERFTKQAHMIVDSPIDGAMFLKVLVKDIRISNPDYIDNIIRRENF